MPPVTPLTCSSKLAQTFLRARLRARVSQRGGQLEVALHALARGLSVASSAATAVQRQTRDMLPRQRRTHLLATPRLPQASASPSMLLKIMAHLSARRWFTAAVL